MTEESSGSISFLWHRGVDKVSSKTVKFMPNVTKPRKPQNEKVPDEATPPSLSKKQHRRAQVRKAQIEHRHRKENYVKHLEQDVLNLHEMISATETEASSIKQENDAIKHTLSRSNLPTSLNVPIASQPPEQDFSSTNDQSFKQSPPSDFSNSLSPLQSSQWLSANLPCALVSTNFDDFIDASCLHISPAGTFGPGSETITATPDIFNFPSNTFTTRPPAAGPHTTIQPILSKPLPDIPAQFKSPETATDNFDLSTIAVNFILALEHPCRTHFKPQSYEFDSTGAPSGHELMASTSLYFHAPDPVLANFETNSNLQWNVPTSSDLELQNLLAMSTSLPKGDWEITPVQAWFLLVGKVGVQRLLGSGGKGKGTRETALDEVKRGLGKLVDCFGFGAVMNEALFWEVVGEVIDENGVQGGNQNVAAARYEGNAGWN